MSGSVTTEGAPPIDDVIPGPGATGTRSDQLEAATVTPPQEVMAELVGFICPPGNILSPDLQVRCTEIVRAIVNSTDIAGARIALQGMAPEEGSALQATEVDTAQGQLDTVSGRLQVLRAGGAPAFALNIDGQTFDAAELLGETGPLLSGGGASADALGSGRWGAFLNGNFGLADKDSTARETGFDLNSYGVTGGVDYRFTDQALAGTALSYSHQDADLDGNSGELNTDAFAVAVYGSYYPSAQAFINAIAGYSWNDHDQERRLVYQIRSAFVPGGFATVNQTAFSDTDSDEIAGTLEAGYDFYRGRWTLTPYGRFDVAHVEIDGYTERMSDPTAAGSGFAMQIDDQDYTSVTLAGGGRIGTAMETTRAVLYPHVGAEYVHEFDNDSEDVTGRLVEDRSGSTFLLPTDDPDRNYGNVSAGVTADFRNGVIAHILYQGLVGYEDLNVHAFEVGARLQF